jgi:hypothetical protein
MMLKKHLLAAVLAAPLALSFSFAVPAFGADAKGDAKAESKGARKGVNVDRTKKGSSAQADAVVTAAMADSLVQYGDKNKDAMSLITAVRLLKQTGVRDEKREKKSEGRAAANEKDAGQPRDYSINALVARAKEYAGGRQDLIALADEAAKEGSRGREGGPARHVDRVRAGMTDVFQLTFRGGEPAVVAISGDGDTDLDLIVMDEFGNRVCSADGAGDDEICRWMPRFTGPFNVRIRNLGSVFNQYRMWSN